MLKRKGRGGVKGVLSNVKKNCRIRKQVHPLWKDPATKSDEFLEKVQKAFDPPPSLLGNYIATFFTMDTVAFMQRGTGQIVSVNISSYQYNC